MPAKVSSIEGGKKEMCPHCGVFPEADHPGDTCPRIAQVSHTIEGTHYIYVDLHDWERWLEGHELSIPGTKQS